MHRCWQVCASDASGSALTLTFAFDLFRLAYAARMRRVGQAVRPSRAIQRRSCGGHIILSIYYQERSTETTMDPLCQARFETLVGVEILLSMRRGVTNVYCREYQRLKAKAERRVPKYVLPSCSRWRLILTQSFSGHAYVRYILPRGLRERDIHAQLA
jgi:hypothetical protein